MRCVNEREGTIYNLLSLKNKLTSVFHASVLLWTVHFVITLSKYSAGPFGYRLVIHGHFDNVMTKFMINNRTDAWKTVVNLLNLLLLLTWVTDVSY